MTAPDHSAPTVRPSTPARAVVHAGGGDTTYLRAGSGDVLVLVAPDLGSVGVLETMNALSRSFLVLAAAPGVSGRALTDWFHDFLEGLGVSDAHLLLHASVSASINGEADNA